jgi:hypothetical protein
MAEHRYRVIDTSGSEIAIVSDPREVAENDDINLPDGRSPRSSRSTTTRTIARVACVRLSSLRPDMGLRSVTDELFAALIAAG